MFKGIESKALLIGTMRKTVSTLLCMILGFAMCSCSIFTASAPDTNWGSFTNVKTYSYDEAYYAFMTQNDQMIVVNIYSSDDDSEVFSFEPCRKWDFWGICWESDSYNLWVQSGDIGVICYTMSDEVWSLDYSAVRPDYIISKYDYMST